jgi:preprotein translocase subunit SecY
VLVVTMTAGTAVIMWLGELITDRGVGNGMSGADLHLDHQLDPRQAIRLYQTENGLLAVIAIALLALSSSRSWSTSSRRSAASRCSTPSG